MSQEAELKLVDWFVTCSLLGQPKAKVELREAAKILITSKRELSNGWINKLLSRHVKIYESYLMKNGERFSAGQFGRQKKSWNTVIWRYLKYKNATDIILDPGRVFFCEEVDFYLGKKGVISPLSQKPRHRSQHRSYILLLTYCSDGTVLNPFVVHPSTEDFYDHGPYGIESVSSSQGKLTHESFVQYLRCVASVAQEKRVKLPVILFIRDQNLLEDIQMLLVCKELQIILVRVYETCKAYDLPMSEGKICAGQALVKKSLQMKEDEDDGFLLSKFNLPVFLYELRESMTCDWVNLQFKNSKLFPFQLPLQEEEDEQKSISETISLAETHEIQPPTAIDIQYSTWQSSRNKSESSCVNQENNVLSIPACDTSISSSYVKFCQIIGPTLVKKFTDPNYEIEMRNEMLLFKTFEMLKENNVVVDHETTQDLITVKMEVCDL